MARLLGNTSEIRSQDDWAPVLGGARAKSRHVLCREAGDECYMQSIWHEILTYLTPDLATLCLVPKVSIDSTKYFRKHNFRNDHVVTKIMKIFYYENLELYGTKLRRVV